MKKKEELSEYDKQAADFLEKTGAKISSVYTGHRPYFDDEKEFRATYMVTITREGKPAMVFSFGQSIADSYTYLRRSEDSFRKKEVSFQSVPSHFVNEATKKGQGFEGYHKGFHYSIGQSQKRPSDYSILCCLTKYNPGTFDDFCGDFGYDTDSRKAETTYHAVMKEYSDLLRMFSLEELEEMAEIQ